MSPQAILALAFATVCAYTDLKRGLIYNVVTLPAIPAGLVLNLIVGGLSGLIVGFYGLVAGFVLGLVLVSLRVFFAGDLKLLMAFGAITGFRCVVQTAFLAVVLLGLQGVITLMAKGAFRRTARNIWTWACLLSAKLKTPVPASGITMPAAPAFLVAAIIVIGRGGI